MSPDALRGKVAVVTGATSGIGEAAALALARAGARVVVVARDQGRAVDTLQRLEVAQPDAGHHAVVADLSSMADTRRAGAEIAAREPAIDILFNNAGALFHRREVTAEGLERTFALNHMSYFVLTEALLPALNAAAAAAGEARIVSTASRAHRHARLDFDDLQNESRRGFAMAYGRSKLCNILWTRKLAQRLGSAGAARGVTANCFHPGFVASRFGDDTGPVLGRFMKVSKLFGRTPVAGADCGVYLACSPEVRGRSGGYWAGRKRVEPSAQARDDESARRLWEASAALAARLA